MHQWSTHVNGKVSKGAFGSTIATMEENFLFACSDLLGPKSPIENGFLAMLGKCDRIFRKCNGILGAGFYV